MNDTVSSVLLKILKKHGIRHVFGLPAAQIGMVMDGAGRDPWFSYMTTRHEEAAGHMAHAVAKTTDSMAVCFGTVGPGATNMVPGVACAWADNVPLLALTPNNQSWLIEPNRDLLQNARQLELYSAITKWNACIRYAERAPELIERALHMARSGRPGPVHLDIPCDIGAAPCTHDLGSIPTIAPPRPAPSGPDLDRLVDLIRNAARPVLIAGGGVVRSGATDAFRALVGLTGFAATTTCNGFGVVPGGCPSYLGGAGVFGGRGLVRALGEADLVVAFGCKFSSMIPVNKPPSYPVPKGQKIVQIDIDAESIGRNVPVSLGVVADARTCIELLNAALAGARYAADASWLKEMLAEKARYREEVEGIADAVCTPNTGLLNEAAIARAVARLIPDDAIVVFDGGQTMEWSHTFIQPSHPQRFVFGPGMGHLGMGQPFANGAKAANPDRPVVLVTGDGGMGCTIQELETAARYGLTTITVVMNDSYWGMYRPFAEMLMRNDNFGTKLTNVDFAKIAEGFGCHGEKVAQLGELAPAWERARNSGKPAVIDVQCDFTPHPMDGFWPQVVMSGVNFAPVQM
ncbi:MAG: thiamine pyrophosphate-binding protein [Gammaproteobacteria bacterium]|nr:thiamine pyrophosphate-binding protein [Gammaproteobacteria bacterium]